MILHKFLLKFAHVSSRIAKDSPNLIWQANTPGSTGERFMNVWRVVVYSNET